MAGTVLIPVHLWTWHLYKVTYHQYEGGPAEVTDYAVSTERHIEYEVQDRCPGDWVGSIQWYCVADKVDAPRKIGRMYDQPISEGAFEAGRREAKKRGFTS